MTDREFQDHLRELGKLIFGDRKDGDTRLNESILAIPCICSVSELYDGNPKVDRLIARNATVSTLTVATGGFLPKLIRDELHHVPMWVIHVPHLDENDMHALSSTNPTTFTLTDSYISWVTEDFSVMIEDSEVAESLNDAFPYDRLIVAFTAGDTFILRLIPVEDMVFALQAAGVCTRPDWMDDWVDSEREESDAIDSDDDASDIVTGIYGETAYLLCARYVDDDACPDQG